MENTTLHWICFQIKDLLFLSLSFAFLRNTQESGPFINFNIFLYINYDKCLNIYSLLVCNWICNFV